MYQESQKPNKKSISDSFYFEEIDNQKLNYNKSKSNNDIIISNPLNLIDLDSSEEDLNFKKLAKEKLLDTEKEKENYNPNYNYNKKKISLNLSDLNFNQTEKENSILRKFFSEIEKENEKDYNYENENEKRNEKRNFVLCISGEAFSK
jgi:hypothetical protein